MIDKKSHFSLENLNFENFKGSLVEEFKKINEEQNLDFEAFWTMPWKFNESITLLKRAKIGKTEFENFSLENQNYENYLPGAYRNCMGVSFNYREESSIGELRGQYLNGKGQKKFVRNFMSKIEGNFEYGLINSEGKIEYKNGAIYQGSVRLDKRHGKGKIEFTNGESYEGEWFMGKKHGIGIYRWQGGCQYEGEWRMGAMSGIGKMVMETGEEQEGIWKNNVFLSQA